ncbi:MAG TPA: hypothetical protein VFT05_07765 [Burkholderiaceae bacterium]|nr:hypothetical protein [Burkholderiaceae bacterium]
MPRSPTPSPLCRAPGRSGYAGALLLALCLSACGGGGGSTTTPAPAPATILTLGSSATQAQAGGQPLALTATLDGAGSVSWQLAPGSAGSLSAASGATVNYLPPPQVTAPSQVTITATSGNLSKSIVLLLLPPTGLSLIAGDIGAHNFARDGKGSDVRFDAISDVATDGAGNLYVAGSGDYSKPSSIRKVAADGTVTTFVPGVPGFSGSGGAIPDALHLSVAPDGTLYVHQHLSTFVSGTLYLDSNYVGKLGADGSLTTIARLPDSASPRRIVAAAGGIVYLMNGYHIGQLNADGSYQVLAGTQDLGSQDADGTGSAARFSVINDMIAGPDGTLYVADQQGIRQVTKAGVVTTLARTGPGPTDGDIASANLRGPRSLALDANGALLVMDRPIDGSASYYDVRKIAGGTIRTLFRQNDPAGAWDGQCARAGTPDARLQAGADGALLAINAGAVIRLDADGTRHPLAGMDNDSGLPRGGQGAAARYCDPGMMAADRDGNLYTVDSAAGDARQPRKQLTVHKTAPSGQVSALPQTMPGTASGMVVDAAGRLLVAMQPLGDGSGMSTYGGAIYWLKADGSSVLVAGQPGTNNATVLQKDGNATDATFGGPTLLGADADGNVYLSDIAMRYDYHTTFRKLSAQGTVSTVASLPPGLNAAPDGYVYRADPQARVLYRIAPDGSRSNIAGSDSSAYFGALPVRFNYTTSLVPTGPHSFAVISGSAVLRLILP